MGGVKAIKVYTENNVLKVKKKKKPLVLFSLKACFGGQKS